MPESHARQPSVSPQEGDTLDNVTISEDEARNIMKGLFDLPRLTHSLALGRIAKDERLTAFTDGFMQRNNIQVLTIGYIDSDEFWPRIFRQQRLNKINKADNDNLLAAKIIFVPASTEGPPTGYTTRLELTGKTSTVYELLSISQAEVDSIAASTSQQQLGNTAFATPNEAKETVVSALIAALQRVETGSVEMKDQKAADASLEGIQKIIIKEALASARENIEEWQKAVQENVERPWEKLNACFVHREAGAETILENIQKLTESVDDFLKQLAADENNSELLKVIGLTFLEKVPPFYPELSDGVKTKLLEMVCPFIIEDTQEERPKLVTIEPIDDNMFIPGIAEDSVEIHYSIEKTEKFPLSHAKIEIYKNDGELVYSNNQKIQIVDNGIFYWTGHISQAEARSDQSFIRTDESPFTIKISASVDSEFNNSFQDESNASVNQYVDTFLDNYEIAKYIEAKTKLDKFKYFIKLAGPMFLEISREKDEEWKLRYQGSLDYLSQKVRARTFLGREIMIHDSYWPYVSTIETRLGREYFNNPYYTIGGFNIRFQRGSDKYVSNHSYGMALDIGADRNLFFVRPSLAFLGILANFQFFNNRSTVEEQKEINQRLLDLELEEIEIDSLALGVAYINENELSVSELGNHIESVASLIGQFSNQFNNLVEENKFLRNEIHFLNQKSLADQQELIESLHVLLPRKADDLLKILKQNLTVLSSSYTMGFRKALLVQKHLPTLDSKLMHLLNGLNIVSCVESLKEACAQPENGEYSGWVTGVNILLPEDVPNTQSYSGVTRYLENSTQQLIAILGAAPYAKLTDVVKGNLDLMKRIALEGFIVIDESFVREFYTARDTNGNEVISWGGDWGDRKDYMHFEYVETNRF
ncbi:M15 family metallopeptidase [uncultured Imperialibacter sp.]|uniref:M15 family metallopeptidase n=1 Tax=uncultured Imperialibacter sp. TaxID=1672639 RepID=UPI0030D994B4